MEPVVVYVDVDDTLIRTTGGRRIAIDTTVQCVRRLKSQGARLYCWSAGGADYAREVARELGLHDTFEAFLSKPEVLIDDLELPHWGMIHLPPQDCDPALGVDQLLQRLQGQ